MSWICIALGIALYGLVGLIVYALAKASSSADDRPIWNERQNT